MNKFLFLDFDGVLFDTVDEAYQVCIHTNMYTNIKFSNADLNFFREHRHMVGPAWNYYFIMEAIIHKIKLGNNTVFKESIQSKEFEEDFFLTRKKLKIEDYSAWLQFNRKYLFLDKLEEITNKTLNIYIITTKDKQTVINLLNAYGIDFISYDCILGKEVFQTLKTKKEIIQHILASAGEYKAIFIDDLLSHLTGCKDIKNLNLIQANWGYVPKNSKSEYLQTIEKTLIQIQNLLKEC